MTIDPPRQMVMGFVTKTFMLVTTPLVAIKDVDLFLRLPNMHAWNVTFSTSRRSKSLTNSGIDQMREISWFSTENTILSSMHFLTRFATKLARMFAFWTFSLRTPFKDERPCGHHFLRRGFGSGAPNFFCHLGILFSRAIENVPQGGPAWMYRTFSSRKMR